MPGMPLRFFACVLLALGAVTAHAQTSAEQARAQLYEAAKKEGKVILWSAADVADMRKMAADFNKTFPGIKVEHFEIQPGPAIQRLVVEANAGQANVDLTDTLVSYLQPLLERDLLQPHDWNQLGVAPDMQLYDQKCLDFYHLDVPIAYNTTLVKEGEIKSYEDLLAPKWKGKVVLEARGLGFAILLQTWGADKVNQYIDALKANDALIIKGGTPVAEALAGGQAAIALGTYSGKMESYIKQGAPVQWSTVGPVPAMRYVSCVVKNAPHPNAAALLAWWLTSSREGQDSVYRHEFYGRARDGNLSPIGQAYQKAGTQIVLESLDATVSQNSIKHTAARIGGL